LFFHAFSGKFILFLDAEEIVMSASLYCVWPPERKAQAAGKGDFSQKKGAAAGGFRASPRASEKNVRPV